MSQSSEQFYLHRKHVEAGWIKTLEYRLERFCLWTRLEQLNKSCPCFSSVSPRANCWKLFSFKLGMEQSIAIDNSIPFSRLFMVVVTPNCRPCRLWQGENDLEKREPHFLTLQQAPMRCGHKQISPSRRTDSERCT